MYRTLDFGDPPIDVAEIQAAAKVTLRDYQRDAVEGVFREWRGGHRATLVVIPTGGGKSVVFSEVMRRVIEDHETKKRILVLAHRKELIKQAVGHAKAAGLTAGVEMSSTRCKNEEVVASSIQTLNATKKCRWCMGIKGRECELCDGVGKVYRMTKFDPRDFAAVIVDEAHHAAATSYRRIVKYFLTTESRCNLLGVTATPKRSDEIGLHNIFDSVAYETDIQTLTAEGYLVPIRERFITCDHLELSRLPVRCGEIVASEVGKAFLLDTPEDQELLLHEVVYPTISEAKGQSVLFFAPSVDSANKITAAFNAYEGVSAECVTQETSADERDRITERYKAGETQVLVNCMVFTEGFDAPGTMVVANARLTKSQSLMMQIIGRVTRTLPGTIDGLDTVKERKQAIENSDKSFGTVLQFVGVNCAHDLMSAGSALAGDDVDDRDVSMAVKEATESGELVDMDELIAKAKQAREEAEERKRIKEEERRQARTTQHYASSGEYTAVDLDRVGGRFDAFEDYSPPTEMHATQRQVNLLVKLGISPETAMGYSKRQAGAIISSETSGTGGDFRVTFGKHVGKTVAELPRGYLDWAYQNVPRLKEHIDIMRGNHVESAQFVDNEAPF